MVVIVVWRQLDVSVKIQIDVPVGIAFIKGSGAFPSWVS
jgi:hypothetical protein